MKKSRRMAWAVAFRISLFAVCFAHGNETANEIQILTEGSFHGDEVSAKNGEQWWALVQTQQGLELKQTKIRLEMREDPVMSDPPGSPTGKNISTNFESSKVVFLVKGLPEIKERIVPTIFLGRLFLDPEQQLGLGVTNRFNLKAEGKSETETHPTYSFTYSKTYRLMATGAGKESCLFNLDSDKGQLPIGREAEGPYIVWVGDLDDDGKWDCLIDTGAHYNVSELTLFLSSLAKEGGLVGIAGVFRTVGC
jgi:hypothetical protein